MAISVVKIRDNCQKIINRMADSVAPDEMTNYKPYHQNLHCVQKYLPLVGMAERV